MYADFEAAEKKYISSIRNKSFNIYTQIPLCNGYYIVSELNDVLQSGYHQSPLGYENVDWLVNDLIKLESKMNYFLKNTDKIIKMPEGDEVFVKKK